MRKSSLLAKITLKRGALLDGESRLDESSTFSRLIISSLKEKIFFNGPSVKIAFLR